MTGLSKDLEGISPVMVKMRDWQTFPVKDQTVNTSGSAGCLWAVTYSSLLTTFKKVKTTPCGGLTTFKKVKTPRSGCGPQVVTSAGSSCLKGSVEIQWKMRSKKNLPDRRHTLCKRAEVCEAGVCGTECFYQVWSTRWVG